MMPVFSLALLAVLSSYGGIAGAQHIDKLALPKWLAPLVALVIGGVASFLIPGQQSSHWAAWTFVLLILLSSIAVIDAVTRTIPDILSVLLIGSGLVHGHLGDAQTLPNALVAGALVLTALIRDHAAHDNRIIGNGDIILIAGVIAWFGPILLFDVLILAAVVAGLQVILTRSSTLPFAPAIAIGHGIIWLGGPLF